MRLKHASLALAMLLSFSAATFAQSNDLQIFGYFQNNYTYFNTYLGDTKTMDVNSFLMQQMDVFFQKNLTADFSAFVNLEFTNSYAAQDSIGGFKIQEAWLKYSPSEYLNIKGGLLIPRFNNFNEIKNRTVLLPYIYRPIAYESYFFNQFGTSAFVPSTANLQVYGDIPVVGGLHFNYAGFYGNSETDMLNKNSNFWGPGQDPTPYKLVGGRLGIEYENLQLGVSATSDRQNLNQENNGFATVRYNLGYIPRTRFGAYLNYSRWGFELEGEMIKVNYDISQAQKDSLSHIMFAPTSFDKTYYHVNLLYNFTDKIAGYVGYDYLKGQDNFFISDGLNVYSYGASYRVSDAILLKAQYVHQHFNMWGTQGTRNDYLLGASVYF